MKRFSKNNYLTFAAVLIVVAISLFVALQNTPEEVHAEWLDDRWHYRNNYTIGNSGSAVTNQKVKFDVDTATLISNGKMQSDCDDARFTNEGGQMLPYFLDTAGGACNNASTDFYVLADNIHAGTTTIYFYYGNASAADEGQGSQFSESTFAPTSGPTLGTEEVGKAPIAYWSFDEGFGSVAYNNSSATTSDGTITGAHWRSEEFCVSGGCIEFDGTDDYVDLGNTGASNTLDPGDIGFRDTDNFTLSLWYRGIDTAQNSDWGKSLIGRENTDLYSQLALRNGYVEYVHYNGSWQHNIQSETLVADGEWHHIVYVNHSNETGDLYIDGVREVTGASSSIDVSTRYFKADNIMWGYNNVFTSGFMDEVKIYPYARSEDEVKAEFAARGVGEGVAASFGARNQESISEGLIGYWSMDEIGANTCAGGVNDSCDTSGFNNDALWAGTATATTTAKFGRALELDGDSDYASTTQTYLPDDYDMFGEGLTLAAWVKIDSTSGNFAIFSQAYNNYTWAGYGLFVSGGNALMSVRSKSAASTKQATDPDDLSTTAWSHVVGVLDPYEHKLKIFVNGVMKAEEDWFASDTFETGSTYEAFWVGANDRTGGTDKYFNGSIDEARVYDRALSPREVRDLYEWAPGPVAYWKLDDKVIGASQTVRNVVATSTDGLFDGTTNDSDSSGFDCATRGKFGGGCHFDGVNDNISVIDDNAFDLTKQLTVMAWVKCDELNSGLCRTSSGHGMGFVGKSDVFNLHTRETGGEPRISVSDGSAVSCGVSGYALDDSEWHHVAGVYNGPEEYMRLYVDGVEQYECTSGIPAELQTNTNTVTMGNGIGPNQSGPNAQMFNGYLDEVKIYNYARTQKQIVQDMNGGHPIGGSPVGSQVGYWKFDEGFGTIAYDSSPLGKDGTYTANASSTPAAGKLGKGLELDGTGDYVSVASPGLPTGDFTYSVWVNPDVNTDEAIVMAADGSGGNEFLIIIDSDSKLFVRIDGTAVLDGGAEDTVIPTDTWTHILVTRSGSDIYAYVNGVRESTTGSDSTVMDFSTCALLIGVDADATCTGTLGNEFDGSIDELRIYNSALTEEQIALEYNLGKATVLGSLGTNSSGNPDNTGDRSYCVPGDQSTCRAPIAEWLLDEKAGVTAYDTANDSNDGTLNNDAAWIRGKVGSALNFDGADDYVEISDDDALDLTSGNFTISAWIYPRNGGQNSQGRIISHGGGVSNGWTLQVNDEEPSCQTTSGIVMQINGTCNTTQGAQSTDNAIVFNKWQHVAMAMDGDADTIIVYVDGKRNAIRTGKTVDPSASTDPIRIGIRSSDLNREFDGYIDQVRIYDYPRTAAQMAWEYNQGKPMAHWKLDEREGATAHDVYQNLNGTVTIGASGSVTDVADAWANGASGKRNYSLDFDGTDDYVDLGTGGIGNLVDDSPAVSIAAWINYDSLATNQYDNIVTRGGVGDGSNANFYINVRGDTGNEGRVLVGGRSSGGGESFEETSSNTYTEANTWHHIVGVFDIENDEIEIYIDGKHDITTSVTYDQTEYQHTGTPTITARIGSDDYTLGRGFDGQIDDFRIYNYALTPVQIKGIMDNGAVNFAPVTGAP